MRHLHLGQRAKKPEARLEGAAAVDASVWHEGHASYPLDDLLSSPANGYATQRRGGWSRSAEAVVAEPTYQGLDLSEKLGPLFRSA